jgi:hypothetical protein
MSSERASVSCRQSSESWDSWYLCGLWDSVGGATASLPAIGARAIMIFICTCIVARECRHY